MRLFISYARVDRILVNELVVILREGGHEPVYDYALLPGEDWKRALLNMIEACEAFVYALTPESVQSEWCQWEFSEAVRLSKPVIPVLLRKTEIPESLQKYHYADFTEGITPQRASRLVAGTWKIALERMLREPQLVAPEDAPAPPEDPEGLPARVIPAEHDGHALPPAVTAETAGEDHHPPPELDEAAPDAGDTIPAQIPDVSPPAESAPEAQPAPRGIRRKLLTLVFVLAILAAAGLILWFSGVLKPAELRAKEYVAQAMNEYDRGLYDQAIETLTRAIELDPLNAGHYKNRGGVYLSKGEYHAALNDFSEAIRIKPTYLDAYFQRARAYSKLLSFDEAIADYGKTIELDSQYGQAFLGRGEVYELRQEYERAAADYSTAIEVLAYKFDAYRKRGNLYFSRADYGQAVADYTAALEIVPDNADVLISRGTAYSSLLEHDQAVEDFSRALEIMPTNITALLSRGLEYFNQQLYEPAIVDFTRIITLDANQIMAYKNRAGVYIARQNYQQALADYLTIAEISPGFAEVYLLLGNLYFDMGNFEDAAAAYRQYESLAGAGTNALVTERLQQLLSEATPEVTNEPAATPAAPSTPEATEAAAASTPAMTDTPEAACYGQVVQLDRLARVRSQPNSGAAIVSGVSSGEQYRVVAAGDGWYQIVYDETLDAAGWIASSLLELAGTNCDDLP